MQGILLGVAGLMGACGVILAALAAHKAQGLEPAALMLMVHAPAIVAAVAAAHAGLLQRRLAQAAAAGLALGAILFPAISRCWCCQERDCSRWQHQPEAW